MPGSGLAMSTSCGVHHELEPAEHVTRREVLGCAPRPELRTQGQPQAEQGQRIGHPRAFHRAGSTARSAGARSSAPGRGPTQGPAARPAASRMTRKYRRGVATPRPRRGSPGTGAGGGSSNARSKALRAATFRAAQRLGAHSVSQAAHGLAHPLEVETHQRAAGIGKTTAPAPDAQPRATSCACRTTSRCGRMAGTPQSTNRARGRASASAPPRQLRCCAKPGHRGA